MSIAAVVTRGYGSFGSISFVVTRGYGPDAVAPSVAVDVGASQWWWAQHQQQYVPYGTQPARAYGIELWLAVEFEPGDVFASALARGKIAPQRAVFVGGNVSAAAIATAKIDRPRRGDDEIAMMIAGALLAARPSSRRRRLTTDLVQKSKRRELCKADA